MTENTGFGEIFPTTPSKEPAPRVRTSPARTDLRAIYGPASAYSYFRDLTSVARSQHRGDVAFKRALEAGGRVLPGQGPLPSALDGGEADARGRLRAAAERRDLTSTTGAGGEFVPAGGPPVFIGAAFATAARAKSVMADILPVSPLPESGLKVQTARFGSGSAVAIHVENNPVQETDPSSALATAPVGSLAGQVDASQQSVDLSNLDEAIAAELGNAYASTLDIQVINGSGTAGQLLGLLNVPGISSVTYTSATPTALENLARIGQVAAATGSAFGAPVDTVLMHPRRFAYITTKATGGDPSWPAEPVQVGALPTNLGAGTNEDIVIALARAESPLFIAPPTFRALIDPLSANFEVRFQIYGYSALLANRQPVSIGKLAGTGLVAPTF